VDAAKYGDVASATITPLLENAWTNLKTTTAAMTPWTQYTSTSEVQFINSTANGAYSNICMHQQLPILQAVIHLAHSILNQSFLMW
jgi:hypothetical protein